MADERTVLLISGHSLFREGLRRVIADSPDFDRLEVAGSIDEAAELSSWMAPDVIIFDGDPGTPSGSKLAQLFQLSPDRVVTLSVADSSMTVFTKKQVVRASVEDLMASIQSSDT